MEDIISDIERNDLLLNNSGASRVVPIREAIEEHIKSNRNQSVRHLQYGIRALDELLDGVKGGNLVVISGYTGHGKTTLSRSITNGFHENEYKTLWFQYEEGAEEFFSRFPNPRPSFYVPLTLEANGMLWIEDRIREGILKHNIDAVFIDHLHYLADTMTGRNPSLEIGQVMRRLKLMAVKYNMPFFILAHTGKPSGDNEPTLGACRDSSFVEQEADAVFYVWRKAPPDESMNCVKIAKFRRDGSKMGKVITMHFRRGLLWSDYEN